MKKTLNIRTSNELAYIDGNVLFDDCINVIHDLMGANKTHKLEINSEAIQGYTKAQKIAMIGNTTQFRSKDGVFTVCNTFVTKFNLGKLFYYKINKQ
jgi:hypothetical protein